MKTKLLLPILLLGALGLLALLPAHGQQTTQPRYLVLFKDKANSPFRLDRPQDYLSPRALSRRTRQRIAVTTQDLPVNPDYLNRITQTGAKVIYPTRWFNGALVEASDSSLTLIRALPFFERLDRERPITTPTTRGIGRLGAVHRKLSLLADSLNYGRMTNQLELLGIPSWHRRGFTGEGVHIAVFDAGFPNLPQLTYLTHLIEDERIVDTYDFIRRDGNVFGNHFHGINVLSTIAALRQEGSTTDLVGAAYGATFSLYRTENELSETPMEEVAWLVAAERADSVGVDIINCSLGYYEGFDNPSDDYAYGDTDGKTTIISRAARFAARKGILVVNAAGNEGAGAWRFVTPPADVDSVLSVGATDAFRARAAFSSIGPTVDGRRKPDLAAIGQGTAIGNHQGTGGVSTGNGTSFAAPQIAGFAALVWQRYPQLTAQQVADTLKRAGHQAANPDNFLGFGVPTIVLPAAVTPDPEPEPEPEPDPILSVSELGTSGLVLFPNPARDYLTVRLSPGTWAVSVEFLVASGQAVQRLAPPATDAFTLPLQTLTPGLYWLRVLDTNGHARTAAFLKF